MRNRHIASHYPAFLRLVLMAVLASGWTPAPSVAAEAPELSEIVVTAEKRDSTVQSTAISLTAISGQDLQAMGTPDLAAVAAAVPGVSLRSAGPGLTEYEMRGLSSSAGSSPTVGFYLDETPLTAPAAAQWGKVVIDPNLYDIERIEVLRGPQGTLYGSGSMGGTIKIVSRTADPAGFDASADVQGSGTQGGGANGRASGMLNLPLSDQLAARLVATASTEAGWIDRVVVSDFPVPQGAATRGNVLAEPPSAVYSDVNDIREVAARVSAAYKPIEALTIVPTFLYQETKSGGLGTFDSDPGTPAHYQPFDIAEPSTDRTRLGSLVAKYDAASFGVVLTVADWKRELRLVQDQSENLAYFFATGQTVYPPDGLGGSAIHEDDLMSQFSSELRVVSQTPGPFQWVGGLFFSKFSTTWNVYAQVPGGADLFGTSNELNWTQPQDVKQKSVFGEASYAFTPAVKLSLGARRFWYSELIRTTQGGWASATGSDAVTSSSGTNDEGGFKPKATLSYEPTADATVFATVAKGFRPGGGNAPVPVSGPSSCEASLQNLGLTAAPVFYHSDSVISYELGEKLRFLDRRLSVNASIYHIDWNGVQQTVVLTCGYPFTGNEGKATVDGAEIEATYILGGGFTASANTTYAKAQLAQDVASTGGHKGDELQDTPKWTASTALNYVQNLGGDYVLGGRLGATYVGNRFDVTYGRNEVPSYLLADARVRLSLHHWSSAVFVDNLANKRASLDDVTALSVNVPTFNRVAANQPRTIGLEFHYDYR